MSRDIDDGGPAFPNVLGNLTTPETSGMSLRDWFAGQALSMASQWERLSPTYGSGSYRGIADRAYYLADAMLAERAKEKKS